MNAIEARAIVNRSAENVDITPYLTKIYDKITEYAKLGQTSMNFDDYRFIPDVHFRSEICKAVRSQLRKDGYKIVYHEDPDPGHPCSTGGGETISW